MLFERPQFTEYVMARLVTLSLTIFVIISVILAIFITDTMTLALVIFLLWLAFTIFVFAIYRGAAKMQRELGKINKYLKMLDTVDTIDLDRHFFTREFEQINQNLTKVLEKSKKREEIKQRYNTKLKLKNQQRGDMISAIAHEFRNPIASIIGYAQTLQEDKDIPPALHDKFLGKICNNGDKIEALLGRLVLWNKFESGEAKLHQSTFDLLSLTQEVKSALVDDKYKQRKIIIQGEPRQVEADRTLVEIVIKNLIENALKYSKENVVVTITEDTFSVSDRGVGISEEDMEKVTKKFYRSGTHNWDNSMGLGLSIVKKILALHNTELEIQSRLDEGSTFSFKI
ncbi:MAG: HAMP domain-containing histidine kinase [Campylobacterales bacterium]|nr:HAMP domain-containing histidine kinase [Campylobacterales bacterium]HEO98205.1 HAMP domain-containing histidine kinase [Campylobacterota bacterium]